MKYWEIIADSRVEVGRQRLIPTGAQSGLLTRTATTESVSLSGLTKYSRHFSNLRE